MGFILPSPTSPAEQARALILRKEEIEAGIEEQISILKANDATFQTPLVDQDGFPRADINIYAIRGARVKIIELRNDLKDVMSDIGKALEGHYDPALRQSSNSNASPATSLRPFAKVDVIAPGSPAAEAGLLKEDLVVKFGTLTHESFSSNSLQPLADLVVAHEERVLPIKILRGPQTDVKVLSLTPRKGWGGRGLLGCHIVPFTPAQ